jgi:hypothetical protein
MQGDTVCNSTRPPARLDEPVVGKQKLLAEVALCGREAIVDAVDTRYVESPVEMGVLGAYAFHIPLPRFGTS